MRKLFRVLVRFLVFSLLLSAGAFLALTLYYSKCFPVNTWINGIYCTGKSVEQINQELINGEEAFAITLAGEGGASGRIEAERADIRPDFTKALQGYLQQHTTAFWMENLQQSASVQLQTETFNWNEGKLEAAFRELPFVAEERAREPGVFIVFDEGEGYRLIDGNRKRLDTEKAFAYLKECLARGETDINLVAGHCYEDVEDSPADTAQRELWRLLEAYTDSLLVYDMGAELIPFTPDIMGAFLKKEDGGYLPALDENGGLILNEKAVRKWVEELASAYDTYGKEREFQATRGDTVTVRYGTYGTQLDVEAEVRYLMGAIRVSRSETEIHVPKYKRQGYARGLNDIGGTYIEVDMTDQHMYFYSGGELMLDTDVVTGDVAKGRETPEGVYFIYGKQKNRILRGGDYPTPVDYWLPVVGGVGIHDANWRKSFGGEIYKKNGSHGCINTPIEIVSKLYDMVEVGVPVVMFY